MCEIVLFQKSDGVSVICDFSVNFCHFSVIVVIFLSFLSFFCHCCHFSVIFVIFPSFLSFFCNFL